MTQWHPISTAPRDGTRVILCNARTGVMWVGEWWKSGQCWTMPFASGAPTHWMPLPPRPDAAQGERDAARWAPSGVATTGRGGPSRLH
jgi:hypothetical protein